MDRAARRLLLFSLASLVLVIAFGTLRGALRPAPEAAEVAKYTALFHSHFDQLCWLGAAAAGAALWILRGGYSGPAWGPVLFGWAYPAGAALFSVAFLVKVLGLRLESDALTHAAFGALVSLGGVLLLVAMCSAVVVVLGLLGRRASAPPAGDDEAAAARPGSAGPSP
jgi:hypothetical protein